MSSYKNKEALMEGSRRDEGHSVASHTSKEERERLQRQQQLLSISRQKEVEGKILSLFLELSNAEVKRVLESVAASRNMRVVSMDRAIAQNVHPKPAIAVRDTAAPKGQARKSKVQWKQDRSWVDVNKRHQEVKAALLVCIDDQRQPQLLSELRQVELEMRSLRDSLRAKYGESPLAHKRQK